MENNLQTFCDFVKNLLAEKGCELRLDHGSKYVKLVKVYKGSASVWGFVDKTNGDILKAASFKTPAKHARGNVANSESYKTHTWTGPYYL